MIVTCCPSKVHNGVWRHLKELEQFGTSHYDSDCLMALPEDAKLIIFGGGWNARYVELNGIAKSKGIKTALLFCSPYGQATLSNEINHLNIVYELLMNKTLDYVFTGTKEMADIFKHSRIKFLPQTLDYEKFIEDHDGDVEIIKNAVGLFCSKAPHKNILNQAICLRNTDYHLFTNALDNDVTRVCLTQGVRYTNLGWMTSDEYYGLLKRIPVHLQCSYSEAFDYVVAETLLLGKPILVGPTIDWIYNEHLKINNIDNPLEIKSAINNILINPLTVEQLRNIAITELDKRAVIAKEVLNNV